jgi:F1F0 ATPase subunit 2
MNLNTIFILALMFAAGLALGAFYFVSLWQTVRGLAQTESRVRLLAISFVLRASIILSAFFFLMNGHWERLAAVMTGFVVIRKILIYRLGPQKTMQLNSLTQNTAGRY